MQQLKQILIESGCSLVIRNQQAQISQYTQRGVKDLLHLLENQPNILVGAQIADKVVGKGAAALMVLGKVKQLHAITISQPAVDLLLNYSVQLTFDNLVPSIQNRAKNGLCPIETACIGCQTVQECLLIIKQTLAKLNG